MNTGLTFQYPIWFIGLCILLGAAYAIGLYFRDKTFKDPSPALRIFLVIMGILRFLGITALAILLLSPFLKLRQTKTEKPVIAVVQDNSESVNATLSGEDSAQYHAGLTQVIDRLSEDYEVVTYSFGEQVNKGLRLDFNEKVTNISNALEDINNLYYNQNLGAVLLASDGIYNQGNNPIYSSLQGNYPIYSIALGDTTPKKDLKVGKIYYNKISYLGDKFVIKADVEAYNLNKSSSRLIVRQILKKSNSKKLFEQGFQIDQGSFSRDFDVTLEANQVGLQHIRISASQVEGEVTYENNYKDIFIEVLDSRKKILLVAAAPHPDIAAIKTTLEGNKNYELDIEYIQKQSKPLDAYNLVILHQLPSKSNKASGLIEKIREKNIPTLFIIGSQSSIAELNKVQTTLSITRKSDSQNEVTPSQAGDFSLFSLSEKTRQNLSKFPPLFAPFAEYKTSPQAKILLKQKIGAVATDYPLLSFSEVFNEKSAILSGEGIWRWRLYDYYINKNHDSYNELINKTIQYLSVKTDKRKFRISMEKNIFFENEPVKFDGQLYDENYELINTPDVKIVITDEDDNEYPFTFSKAENTYSLNAGFLPVGRYSYSASVSFNNKNHRAGGEFSISPLQLEALQTQANHQMLYLLSQQTGGKIFYPQNITQISDEINSRGTIKPVMYETVKTQSVINLKWIFYLILAMIALEWFLRKYFGGY